MRTAFRHPAVHFLIAGAAIFAVIRWVAPSLSSSPDRYRIVITAAQIDAIHARRGEPPTEEQTAAFVDAAATDEMLYREALARGMDSTDAVVERRLVQNMRFLSDQQGSDDALLLRQAQALGLQDGDPVVRRRLIQRMRSLLAQQTADEAPTEDELRSYFNSSRSTLAPPPSVRLSQIFFSGPDAAEKAAAALATITATRAGAEAAAGYGDPFLSGTDLPPHSERGLAKLFGPQLAHTCLSLPVGSWTDPVRSAYGVHLLWIHDRVPGESPRFETVRDSVRRRLEAERAEERLRAGVAELRTRYHVEFDSPRS